jgi:hypothetical protein
MIIATPNIADWRVLSQWFWMDPTHVRPYPPNAIRTMLKIDEWTWDTSGHEPIRFTRHTPGHWLNRVRYGREYGCPGMWYRLVRTARAAE